MRRLLAIFVVLITSGCATTPHFDKISGVTPKTIVDVIECEIIAARKKYRIRSDVQWARFLTERQSAKQSQKVPDLRGFHAVAELTLQVDEQLTLAPAFTHTDVVSKSLTRIFDWGVKFDTQSQRVYSESVVFDIAGMADDKPSCRDRPPGVSLNGTLGIEEVVDMAFGSIDPDDQGVGLPEAENGVDASRPYRQKAAGAKARLPGRRLARARAAGARARPRVPSVPPSSSASLRQSRRRGRPGAWSHSRGPESCSPRSALTPIRSQYHLLALRREQRCRTSS